MRPLVLRFVSRLGAPLVAGGALLVGACQTAPPPPPPAPVIIAPEGPPVAVEPEAVEPQVLLRVTGSSLNVRESAITSAATITRVKRGARLLMLGVDGDWFKVALDGGKAGWVHGKYVQKEAPCLPDRDQPDVLEAPPPTFGEGEKVGQVVVEATVSSEGVVTGTKITRNTTGDEVQAARAVDEVTRMRFAPPIKHCRPVAFIYVYSRRF